MSTARSHRVQVRRTPGWRSFWQVTAAMVLLVAVPPVARAQIGSDRYSSIVVDVASGTVLEEANPDAPRYPAMTVITMKRIVRATNRIG